MKPKKSSSVPRSPLPYDASYDAFVQGLELFGLGMKSCRCDLDRRAFFSLEETTRKFTHNYRLTEIDDVSFDAEGDFELSVSASPEISPPLKMECVFQVHVHAKPGFTEEHAKRFVSNELRLILVPHARQLFFTLSGQMNVPGIVSPLTTGSPDLTVSKQTRKPGSVASNPELGAPSEEE